MEQDKISIIVPVFNLENYIGRCLDSLIAQTYRNLEIICVNDDSTDNSGKVLNEFVQKDDRIQVIELPKSGAGVARNTGLKKATGTYITFVDGDDWLDVTMLEQLHRASTEKSCNISMCYANCLDDRTGHPGSSDYFDLERKELNRISATVLCEAALYELLPYVSMVPWKKLYSKKLLDDHHITFAKNIFHEDLPFFFGALLNSNGMAIVRKPLYNYTVNRKGSTTNARLLKYYRDFFPIFDRIESELSDKLNIPGVDHAYRKIKVTQLLGCLNAVHRDPNLDAGTEKQFFNKVRNALRKTGTVKTTDFVDSIQRFLIRQGFHGLFKLKVKLDLLKEKAIP